jgi:hypothetical protein
MSSSGVDLAAKDLEHNEKTTKIDSFKKRFLQNPEYPN